MVKLTNFGQKCYNMINSYKELSYYYDEMSGCCVIPIKVLKEKQEILKDVIGILKEDAFVDDNGVYENWALELYNDGEKDCISIRTVESY